VPVTLVGEEDCLAGCQPVGEQIPGLVSQYTVQNALVLGLGMWREEAPGVEVTAPGEEGEEPVIEEIVEGEEEAVEEAPPEEAPAAPPLSQITVVTLAVDPQYALVLKWSVETNSSMDLVLRSASDIEEFAQPESVTLEYMINRYAISPPPRLPYSPENEFTYSLIEKAEEYAPPAGE
jgi:hypothetical protein